ncbi:MAG: hypothetical protein IPP37_22045 [Saprospiraceae bacterium]|nr:hypothetical protein [Saprospiraceae bacterium]
MSNRTTSKAAPKNTYKDGQPLFRHIQYRIQCNRNVGRQKKRCYKIVRFFNQRHPLHRNLQRWHKTRLCCFYPNTRTCYDSFYKDDVKFEGQFLNEKNQRQIYEYKNGVPEKVIENDSYIVSYFGLTNEKREGLCVQQQRFGPKNKWEIVYKNEQPYEGLLVEENKIITYKAGQQTGLLWEYESDDLIKLNARYDIVNGVKNGKAVIFDVYENGDSIQMEYQGGVVQNGTLVTSDPRTRIKKIYTLNNGVASSDSTYLYPSYDGKPKEYLKFQNGKIKEGTEYKYNLIAITNQYKNYLLLESRGRYDDDREFTIKCTGLKCRFYDRHHKLFAYYLYDTLNHSLSIIAKDVTGDSLRAKIVNDTLAEGSILFYNYKRAKRDDHFIWDKAIVTLDKSGTSITLFNEKYDFYPVYFTSQRMAVPFPSYDANPLIISLLTSEQIFKVSYRQVHPPIVGQPHGRRLEHKRRLDP